MDWKKLADQAKAIIDKRGGPESVKRDAEELTDIAGRQGSFSDKLKAAADAIREPGAPGEPSENPPGASSQPPPSAPPGGGR